MTRTETHKEFVAAFAEGEHPTLATTTALSAMERELGTLLPQAYLTFMQTHGAVRTPSLPGLVVDAESDLWALADFFAPEEAVGDTKLYWSGGMSTELVGFAGDGMGNMFCFRRLMSVADRPDDAPVWFFDHEFPDDDRELAQSFDGWLGSFLELRKGSAP
jgi:hypothetical protein